MLELRLSLTEEIGLRRELRRANNGIMERWDGVFNECYVFRVSCYTFKAC